MAKRAVTPEVGQQLIDLKVVGCEGASKALGEDIRGDGRRRGNIKRRVDYREENR